MSQKKTRKDRLISSSQRRAVGDEIKLAGETLNEISRVAQESTGSQRFVDMLRGSDEDYVTVKAVQPLTVLLHGVMLCAQ